IFINLAESWNRQGNRSFYFLGSTSEVLEKIRKKMTERFPNIKIAGTYSPPYKAYSDSENSSVVEEINKLQPTALWVGMTAPKQEKWIYSNIGKLDVPFIVGIGAVFDFFAGTKKRSPEWSIKIGVEWLPRLIREPKRMWKRTFVSFPVFMYYVAKQWVKQKFY
ncbi:MAG: WecB/TagA/CpsF family glycosyltransferase, partial [Candidatus Omnitrophota bacterium]